MLLSCESSEKAETQQIRFDKKKEFDSALILSHKAFLKIEKKRIDLYIDSLGIDFKSSGTGLRYWIKPSEAGDSLFSGDIAIVQYTLKILNGDILYQSPKGVYQEFVVDYDHVESGLHEGIKYMKVGDEAILILPAHIAHGITGDQAAIPSQSTLVYELKLYHKK